MFRFDNLVSNEGRSCSAVYWPRRTPADWKQRLAKDSVQDGLLPVPMRESKQNQMLPWATTPKAENLLDSILLIWRNHSVISPD